MSTLQREGNWGSERIKCFSQEHTAGWKQAKTIIQIFWFPGSGALFFLRFPPYPRLHHLSLSYAYSKVTLDFLGIFWFFTPGEEKGFPCLSLNLPPRLQITQHSLCGCLPCWRASVPGLWKSISFTVCFLHGLTVSLLSTKGIQVQLKTRLLKNQLGELFPLHTLFFVSMHLLRFECHLCGTNATAIRGATKARDNPLCQVSNAFGWIGAWAKPFECFPELKRACWKTSGRWPVQRPWAPDPAFSSTRERFNDKREREDCSRLLFHL